MNNEYVDVINFLNYKSMQAHELASRQQPSEPSYITVDTPISEFRENLTTPQITWEDVLQMIQSLHPSRPKQERFILFLKSAQKELKEHTHSYFEMIYVLSGSCTHCINGNIETLHEGDLCILSPSAHHVQYQDSVSITAKLIVQPFYFTNICPGLLDKKDYMGIFLINSLYSQNKEPYLLFHTGQDVAIRVRILEIGRESLRDDNYSDRIVSGLLMSLLATLTRDYPSNLQLTSHKNIHHEILSLLKNEYDTITLESLAKRLHYSVPYCSKYIKKLFGLNFSQLLQQIRFQMAEQYLQCSDLTVIQISKKLGYENPENFIRAFKKYFHLTPAQYRINHKSPLL